MILRKLCSALMVVCIAAPCMAGGNVNNKQDRARMFLKRTVVVIIEAKKKVDENKVYTGNLAKAVNHQKFARRLFKEGRYGQAVQHSRRARHLAILAIRANRGVEPGEDAKDLQVNEGPGRGPSDADLDKAVAQQMSAETTRDDAVAVNLQDLDIK
jgi:hypothetical protein